MQLTNDQKQIIETEINPVIRMANEMVIKTNQESLAAQETLRTIKIKRNQIHEKFDPPVRAAHSAWKAAKELYNFFTDPFDKAESAIKQKVVAFQVAEDRRVQDELRKREAARLEAERKQREKLEAQGRKAAENGKLEKAEALLEAAQEVAIMPEFETLASEKANGTSFKRKWKAKVVDIKALCRAIADGQASPELVLANESALNKLAGAIKNTMQIPGVEVAEELEMAVRTR